MSNENSENNGLMFGLMIAVLVIGLMSMYGVYTASSGVTLKEVQDEMAKIKVPSAQEIADKVVLPEMKEFDIPEFKSDSKVLDLWENLYSENISKLKDNAYADSLVEFENEYEEGFFDWLERNIEGFDDFKSSWNSTDAWDENDCDAEVVGLGLEDDEDKSAKVVCEVKVKYELNEGADESYKKYVIVSSDVSYEEGNFDDKKVKLSYAFAE